MSFKEFANSNAASEKLMLSLIVLFFWAVAVVICDLFESWSDFVNFLVHTFFTLVTQFTAYFTQQHGKQQDSPLVGECSRDLRMAGTRNRSAETF